MLFYAENAKLIFFSTSNTMDFRGWDFLFPSIQINIVIFVDHGVKGKKTHRILK
jgi:hypothetical protein